MTNLSICDRPVTPAGNAAAVPAAEPAQDLAHWDDDKRADLGFHAWSLDAPLSGDDETASLADLLGDVDGQVEHALDMAAVSAQLERAARASAAHPAAALLRNKTQAEIGETLGISQMHVSRLLTQSLSYLRECLLGPEEQLTAEDQLATVGGA